MKPSNGRKVSGDGSEERRGEEGAEESWRKMSGVKQKAANEKRGRMDGWRACSDGWLSSMKVTVVLSWVKAGAAC